MGNDSGDSLLVGFNTPSPVMKQRWLLNSPANATPESLLHSSPPKTDEDVAIYDALERPRSRTRLSTKSLISGIGNLSGASGSSLSSSIGGSSRMLNPRAREYKPKRFSHSEQELRSGISNLSSIEICRLAGGSSGGLNLPPSPDIYPTFVSSPIPIPNLYLISPQPSPTNNSYHSPFENSPEASSPMTPPQPPFLVRPIPETPRLKPTISTPKCKSPVTLNLPSEPVKKPSLDESTSDATVDLPTAPVATQSPLYSDWVPLDDGIECTLPPGLTWNGTRVSALLSAGSSQNETPDSTSPSAGSAQNETQSIFPYGLTQSIRSDYNLASDSTDQNQTFSRDELHEYINMVLYEVHQRKRLPVFENITISEMDTVSIC